MTATLFVSEHVVAQAGEQISALLKAAPRSLDLLVFQTGAVYTSAQLDSVEAAYYSRDVWQGTVQNQLSPAAEAFWQHVDRARNLKWLQVLSAGVDQHAYRPSIERGVLISTSSGTNAEPVGLNAVAGLMMLARGFPHWMEAQRERRWAPVSADRVPRDLPGQTALIVGTGHIGTVIARCLQAVGMQTIGLRRQGGTAPFFDEVHGMDALDEWLPRTGWLVLACPLTPSTCGLVDARRLALLPRGAGIVNIARGQIVHEAALIDALGQGRLLGAYLDVFEQEPLPSDSPLWSMPNVLITPHNAAVSSGNEQRGIARFLENLRAYLHGTPLESVVRPS